MKTYFISEEGLQDFAKSLSEKLEVYAPYYPKNELKAETDESHYFKVTPECGRTIDLKGIRTVEPLKVFFFKLKSFVANYSKDGLKDVDEVTETKRAIFGVRDCDIKAMRIQDVNFLEGDFYDPFFANMRKSTLIFSSDCTFAGKSCFCTLLGQNPYAEEDYDLNFASVKNGYMVEVGSEKGQKVIDDFSNFFKDGGEKYKKDIDAERKRIKQDLVKQNKQYDFEGSVVDVAESNIRSPRWTKEIETCIECGACTNVCPSCRCYYLRDQLGDEGFERIANWDSCQIPGYSRMAGGGNARPLMVDRFSNRFMCKFNWGVKIFGEVACKGCGRCVDACMGKIDIRSVMKGIAMDVQLVK
ncbi:MAG: 4Fe-4S dicluster domain-containing protein [Acidobacteria bacterium]|nr:4Fe-4S dicluster domain-containing protein [Acidobacteriota bacterium]